MSPERKDDPPDLPTIGQDDEMTDASVRKLLKDIFPAPEDPLTSGLKKGDDYKLARIYFPNSENDENQVTAYHALSDAARRRFMSNFFVEIEVVDPTGIVRRFFVSEYDALRAERFGAKRI